MLNLGDVGYNYNIHTTSRIRKNKILDFQLMNFGHKYDPTSQNDSKCLFILSPTNPLQNNPNVEPAPLAQVEIAQNPTSQNVYPVPQPPPAKQSYCCEKGVKKTNFGHLIFDSIFRGRF